MIYFLHSYAVLSRHGSSNLHAQFEYGGAEFLGPFHFVRFIRIEQDQRVQVAVARMEDVGAAQAEVVFHLFDGAQHARQMTARDGAVHAVVIGRHAPRGGERVLAAGPEFQALGLRRGHLAAGGAGIAEDCLHARDLVRHLFGRAVGLA